jgi:hypothetical protein
VAVFGRNGDQRANAAVDMQPESFPRREIGQSLQIVYGAGIDGSGRGDDAGRLKAGLAVFADGSRQSADVDAPLAVRLDPAKRSIAKPERLHRLAMA